MKVQNTSIVLQDIKAKFMITLVIVSLLFVLMTLIFRHPAPERRTDKYGTDREQEIHKDMKKLDDFRL